VLRRVDPSPVVALNHAVALGMRDGPAAGLVAIESVLARGLLDDYHLAHAARADMLRRLALTAESPSRSLGLARAAQDSYQRALDLTRQPAERRFLQARLAQLAHVIPG
jgi:RNA polymerase sigma-70 factor (ECF subfamily)